MAKKYDIRDYQWTTDDIHKYLGYNRQYIRVLAKSGKLPAIKRFRQWMFCKEEVEAFFQGQQGQEKQVTGANDNGESGAKPADSAISDFL